MTEIIKKKLIEIEKSENIKILYAAESGSRGWGFASPDSDFDVRFIYLRPLEFYLKLEKTRDVIELPINDILDINGWDLQKALRLLNTSNPTLFEWSNSPIVYMSTPFWEDFKGIINEYFKSKAGLYHYLNTARGNYREYLKGEQVRVKKYFYVLRPILACKWILKNNTPPPMLFTDLMEASLEDELKPAVYQLLDMKINLPEIGEIPKVEPINRYIEENLDSLNAIIQALPDNSPNDMSKLEQVFLRAVGELK